MQKKTNDNYQFDNAWDCFLPLFKSKLIWNGEKREKRRFRLKMIHLMCIIVKVVNIHVNYHLTAIKFTKLAFKLCYWHCARLLIVSTVFIYRCQMTANFMFEPDYMHQQITSLIFFNKSVCFPSIVRQYNGKISLHFPSCSLKQHNKNGEIRNWMFFLVITMQLQVQRHKIGCTWFAIKFRRWKIREI